jgi:hypothetical protein
MGHADQADYPDVAVEGRTRYGHEILFAVEK